MYQTKVLDLEKVIFYSMILFAVNFGYFIISENYFLATFAAASAYIIHLVTTNKKVLNLLSNYL
jgi:hypothetical protein